MASKKTASLRDSEEFETLAIHAGQEPDKITGAVCVPISLASTFAQTAPGVHTGYEYSRTSNPTRKALERNIAALEHGQHGLAFASGSAATMTILHLLKAGDHVVSADDVYGGTNRYFDKVARKANNMDFSFIDMTKPGTLEASITDKTKMIWIETPSNPTLKIVDIEHAVKVGKKNNLLTVVDNTFASPYLQTPLDMGADIVVHSATKYLNGHSDIVLGLVVTNSEELRARLAFLQNSIGAVPSPFDCYMVMRGIKTLHLRMQRHCENAMAIAKALEGHAKIEKVIYPGLESHPQHKLAARQMTRGFGGMVSAVLTGGEAEGRAFLASLQVFTLAESLGAVESLVELPAVMTHLAVPADQRHALGIDDSLIRFSVGVENVNDLVADIMQALDKIPASS
eukprot:988312_1